MIRGQGSYLALIILVMFRKLIKHKPLNGIVVEVGSMMLARLIGLD